MKRLFVIALPLLLSTAAIAQPDPNMPGTAINPPVVPAQLVPNSPLNGALYFLQQLSSEREVGFSLAVAGARVGFIGGDEWDNARLELYPFNAAAHLTVESVNVDEQNEEEATVSVVAHRRRPDEGKVVPGEESKKYILRLRCEKNLSTLVFGQQSSVWRVVPLSTGEVLAKPLRELPPFQLVAALALRDPLLLPLLRQQRGLEQLAQLGSGTWSLAKDCDEYYAFDDAAYERALDPYVEEESLFVIPRTKNEKWHFNDNLSGKALAALAEPARTALFYDGSSPDADHLNFRFGDKTLLCFADGHVEALTKGELKDVLWKP